MHYDEDEFHARVVQRDEAVQQIQVPGDEHEQVQLLGLQRDARAGLGGVDFQQQHLE